MKIIALSALAALAMGLAAAGGSVSASGHGDSRAQACDAARSNVRGEAQSDAMRTYGTSLYRITSYGSRECDDDDGRWTCSTTARYEVDE